MKVSEKRFNVTSFVADSLRRSLNCPIAMVINSPCFHFSPCLLQIYKVLDKLLKISNSILRNMFKISDPLWYKNLLKEPHTKKSRGNCASLAPMLGKITTIYSSAPNRRSTAQHCQVRKSLERYRNGRVSKFCGAKQV